jgi:hypothetical protein
MLNNKTYLEDYEKNMFIQPKKEAFVHYKRTKLAYDKHKEFFNQVMVERINLEVNLLAVILDKTSQNIFTSNELILEHDPYITKKDKVCNCLLSG